MQIEKRGECSVIRLEDPTLGASNYTEFKSEITQLANDGQNRLVLDFGAVEMVDSSGLGALISVMKTVGREGKVALVGVKPKVRNVFRMTRLDRLFPIYETLDAAETALG